MMLYRRSFSTGANSGPGRIGRRLRVLLEKSKRQSAEKEKATDDVSLKKHVLKTFATYAIPMSLFGAFSFYSMKMDEKNRGKDSFGNLLGRFLQGENVFENLGPRREYIKVTRLNDRFDNYRYCLEKTAGKSLAELRIRHSEMLFKLGNKGVVTSIQEKLNHGSVTGEQLAKLLEGEKRYQLEMKAALDMMDTGLRKYRGSVVGATANKVEEKGLFGGNKEDEEYGRQAKKALMEATAKQLKAEKEYFKLLASVLSPQECDFVKEFLQSPDSPGIAAFLVHQEAPLSSALLAGGVEDIQNQQSSSTTLLDRTQSRRVYVLKFDGDIVASAVSKLREEVTAVLQQCDPARGDSVVVRLNSGGGTVTGYGLAASQLERLKQANLPLTVCVDEVAASGGYLMACVGDRICASPFAAVGSIGVISTNPNFYERLKREGVTVTDVTAGKYKRTLTPYKSIDPADKEKMQEDVAAILSKFQNFVLKQRPALTKTIDDVATGEVWFGPDAVARGLVDELKTFDDVLLDMLKSNSRTEILQLKYMGDVIERREEQHALFESQGAPVGSQGGLVDRCVDWFTQRIVEKVFQRLLGGMVGATNGCGLGNDAVSHGDNINSFNGNPSLGASIWNGNAPMALDRVHGATTGNRVPGGAPLIRDDRFDY